MTTATTSDVAEGFAPLRPVDGYLPIEDHGLVGDGTTAALVARDGSVVWLCLPRFDSDPVFASLLDRGRGGRLSIRPEGLRVSRQRYVPGTGVLVTELRTDSAALEITDCMTLRSGADLAEDVAAGRGELLRSVRVSGGSGDRVRVHVDVEPRGGASAGRRGEALSVRPARRPDLGLELTGSAPLDGLHTSVDLEPGEGFDLVLRWRHPERRSHHRVRPDPPTLLEQTVDAWRRWSARIVYTGPQQHLVARSAITLKMLDVVDSGAIVAAPTSSLPERIGGVRNWDYRYAWVRDAAFSVYALRRVGLESEARGFLGWVLDSVERHGRPWVLYDLDGGPVPAERIDPDLEGYRRSAPVRFGNAAADQVQHDAYGEIVDCAYQWVSGGGTLEGPLWEQLATLVDEARRRWSEPDQGIWEVRTPGRVFTYSAAMCHVAMERAARLAESRGRPGDVRAWREEAARIHDAILEDAWDPELGALTEHIGHRGGLDASLLALPLRRVVDARHPRMVATVEAIRRRLGAGEGLLYRYLPEESPDGVAGHEGAFLLCSFWLVDNLAAQGHVDEAGALYESLCARAGPLGLLPEEIDPGSGAFLGNYPQGFSHVGVISSGINLARHLRS